MAPPSAATAAAKRPAETPGAIPEHLASNKRALLCRNRIRETIAELSGRGKTITLDLAIGDPTRHGAPFAPPEFLTRALSEAVLSGANNGYGPAFGTEASRSAVARDVGHGITPDDVVMTCGCSQALELVLRSLAGPGDSILVPTPGFPLYRTILELLGVTVETYVLDPNNSWQVDLDDLANTLQRATRVKGVIVTNPSNPTGSVFSLAHCREICALVGSVPGAVVLADEIYEEVVFEGTFASMGPLHVTSPAPVVTFSGLSKGFFCPGWRLGWFVVWDGHDGRLSELRVTARKLSATLMGPCTLVQSIVSTALLPPPASVAAKDEFRKLANAGLKEAAEAFCDALQGVPGVRVAARPQGAMYILLSLDGQISGLDFCQRLVDDEGLLVLPGECFSLENSVRVSLAPAPFMIEAVNRIKRVVARWAV